MKKILLLTILCILSLSLKAQSSGEREVLGIGMPALYSYDASGNRILRKADMYLFSKGVSKGILTDAELAEYEKPISSSLDKFELMVYPNPTQGELNIRVKGEEEILNAELNIYTINGKSIYRDRSVQEDYKLDISSYAAGMYILRLVLNGKSHEWKVIKK